MANDAEDDPKHHIGLPEEDYPVLDDFRGLGRFFRDAANKYADDVAQIDSATDNTETYGEVNARCVQLAIELRTTFGVRPGDTITLCSYNTMDSCVPLVAATYVGAVVSFLDPTLSPDTTRHLLRQVQPKVVFFGSESIELIENALKAIGRSAAMVAMDGRTSTEHVPFAGLFERRNDPTGFVPYRPPDVRDTAVVLFSSGSTGLAKGISLSHYGLIKASAHWPIYCPGITTLLHFTSFYWISAVSFFIITYMVGGRRVIVPRFDGDTALDVIEKYKVSIMVSATIHIHHFKTKPYEKYDFAQLKYAAVGGTPSTPAQLALMKKIFPHSVVVHGYGMTEISGIVSLFNPTKHQHLIDTKPGSVGFPVPGITCKIVDLETERTVGANRQGEIRLRCDFLMNGYYNRPSDDAWDADGWLCSGDVGYYDDDRCLYVSDRIKDMLKFQTWHVTPVSIEAVLQDHPQVLQAVVVGIPHEVDGDLALGVVVLKDKVEDHKTMELELVRHVADRMCFRDRLHGGVRIVDEVPKTPTGKLRRRDLRVMVQEGRL